MVTRPRSDVLIIAPHFLRNFITDRSGWLAAGCIYTREPESQVRPNILEIISIT